MKLRNKFLFAALILLFIPITLLTWYFYSKTAHSVLDREKEFLNYRLNNLIIEHIKPRHKLLVNTDLITNETMVEGFKKEILDILAQEESIVLVLENGETIFSKGLDSRGIKHTLAHEQSDSGDVHGHTHNIFVKDYFDEWKWLIILGMPDEIKKVKLREILIESLLVVTGSGLILIMIFWFFARMQIIAPIENLTALSEDIANQKFRMNLINNRSDELGVLHDKMLIMKESIQKSLDEKQAWNLELEGKVRSRTEELSSLNRDLSKSLEANHHFVASVSHDLRTPLNAIIGYSDLIIDSIEDGEKLEVNDLHHIRDSGHFLLRMVDDILMYNTLSTGHFSVKHQEIDLHEFFISFRDSILFAVKKNNNELILNIPNHLPLFTSDPLRLKQILTNIVGNAAKFTNQGEISVGVKFNHKQLIIEIADNGIGIPSSKLESIFEAFTQVHDLGKIDVHGTGLGLAICKKMVRQLDGEISVTSIEGKGTCFKITFEQSLHKNHAA